MWKATKESKKLVRNWFNANKIIKAAGELAEKDLFEIEIEIDGKKYLVVNLELIK
jgi:hypothetical protein